MNNNPIWFLDVSSMHHVDIHTYIYSPLTPDNVSFRLIQEASRMIAKSGHPTILLTFVATHPQQVGPSNSQLVTLGSRLLR